MDSVVTTIRQGQSHRFPVPFHQYRNTVLLERGESLLMPLQPAHGASDLEGHFVGQEEGAINDGSIYTHLTAVNFPSCYPAIWLPGDAEIHEIELSWHDVFRPAKFVLQHSIKLGDSFGNVLEVSGDDVDKKRHDIRERNKAGGWWRVKVLEPRKHVFHEGWPEQAIFAQLIEMRFFGRQGAQTIRKRIASEGSDIEVLEDLLEVSVRNLRDEPIEAYVTYDQR